MTMLSPPKPEQQQQQQYNLKNPAWTNGILKRPSPSKRHDFGLDFEFRRNNTTAASSSSSSKCYDCYITRVEGLALEMTDLQIGDRLIKFQDKDPVNDFTSLEEIRTILKEELKVSFEALHQPDPDPDPNHLMKMKMNNESIIKVVNDNNSTSTTTTNISGSGNGSSNGDRTPSPPVRHDSEPSTNTKEKRFMPSPKKYTRDTIPRSPTKKKTPPVVTNIHNGFVSSQPKKKYTTRDTAPKSPTKKKTPPVITNNGFISSPSPRKKNTNNRDIAPKSPKKKKTPPPVFVSPSSSSPKRNASHTTSSINDESYVDPEEEDGEEDFSVQISVDISEITEPSSDIFNNDDCPPCIMVDESPYPQATQRKRPPSQTTKQRRRRISSLTASTGTYTPPSSPHRTTTNAIMSFSPTRQSPKANKLKYSYDPSSPSSKSPITKMKSTSNNNRTKTTQSAPTKTKKKVVPGVVQPPPLVMSSSPKKTSPGGRYSTGTHNNINKNDDHHHPGPKTTKLEYNLKAWVRGSLTRPPSRKHDFGLDFDLDENENDDGGGIFYVSRCEALCKQLSKVHVGDRLLKFQNLDATTHNYTLPKLRQILDEELHVTFETLHPDEEETTINNNMQQQQESSITEIIDMDIDIGDIVRLQNMEDSDLNGKNIQVLRDCKKGKWLVKVLDHDHDNGEEDGNNNNNNNNNKILVKSENLKL